MIRVLIPSWNNSDWIERCLQSVKAQTNTLYSVLVVDDHSDDGSWQLIQEFCGDQGWDCYRTEQNQKCPRNLWEGINRIHPDPEDVIYLLDGDDFLPHGGVFTRVAEIFSDPDVWLTYGNYDWPIHTGQERASDYPDSVKQARAYRACKMQLFNHPLIFRAHLWGALSDADLKDEYGNWLAMGYDKVIMLPMLELASPLDTSLRPHWRFIDETLYTYNSVNPQSDVNRPEDPRVLRVWDRPVKLPHEGPRHD